MDAIALAERALGVDQLILAVPPPIPADFEAALATLVGRREAREPLQHIVGYAVFRRLSVRVEPGVFLPRPETEVVTQAAVDEARRLIAAGREPLVVDLCTGSGVIAVSLAVEVPGSRIVAVDIDPAAVRLAVRNAAMVLPPVQSRAATIPAPDDPAASPAEGGPPSAGAARGGAGVVRAGAGVVRGGAGVVPTGIGVVRVGATAVRIEVGDVADPELLADLAGLVDIVIGNPPYIPDDGVPLDREVAEHDPPRALFGGGPGGLDLPRHVVRAAARLLRPGGLFVMEHADLQGEPVRDLVDRTGAFTAATTHQDLTGRDRFVTARRAAP